MPRLLRNPLWHWTHLELSRVFGIDDVLDESTAPRIWAEANEKLQSISAHSLLGQFRVNLIGTTDDPCDDLAFHRSIRESGLATSVYPSFRRSPPTAPRCSGNGPHDCSPPAVSTAPASTACSPPSISGTPSSMPREAGSQTTA
jgi:hypothetical protein